MSPITRKTPRTAGRLARSAGPAPASSAGVTSIERLLATPEGEAVPVLGRVVA